MMAPCLQAFAAQSNVSDMADHSFLLAVGLLQVTSNLASFWAESYTAVKKEMKGRYPKHFWPDDPAAAAATNLTKKQMAKTGGPAPATGSQPGMSLTNKKKR